MNQVFDGNKNHAYWELFVSETKGMYAYLFDSNGGHEDYTIDSNLRVGDTFTLKTVVSGGTIKIYYNGQLNQTIKGSTRTGLYFKAGDYCQSITSEESHGDYCEVLVEELSVSHV